MLQTVLKCFVVSTYLDTKVPNGGWMKKTQKPVKIGRRINYAYQ